MKPGTKVGVIFGGDPKRKVVEVFGEGVYVGDELPGEDAVGLAAISHEAGMPNPKIVLLGGSVVWGCECWWGLLAKIKAELAQFVADGYSVELITPTFARARAGLLEGKP